jgi:hypothetical protein
MKKVILISFFLALAAQGQQQQRIAILGTEDDGDPPIEILELTHLTDKLREIAGKTLPKNRYGIMTQQSIVDRLGSQEQAAKMCREATCLADLGRKVNADYIAQARIGRFSGNLTIKIELYNVGSGNLIASFTDDSENVKGLLAVMEVKAPALFRNMPGVSSGAASPAAVQGGISGLQGAEGYEFDYQKRYLANVTTEPEGAILSFDGAPDARCAKTPCRVELAEGSVRIVAVLEQYEKADTVVSIKQNNQNIAIKLKSNFGVLEIKPAYLEGIGASENWKLTINDKAVSSLRNNLSPGNYNMKLSHRCYEALSFDAGINKGAKEFFDIASHVKLKKGGLVLRAEQGGSPVSELVFVNGKLVGETPFSGTVPVCAEIEIGKSRAKVDVGLRHNEKVEYVVKNIKYTNIVNEYSSVVDDIVNNYEQTNVSQEDTDYSSVVDYITKDYIPKTKDVKLDSLNKIRFGIGGVFGLYYNPSEAILNEVTSSEYDFADGRVLKIGLLLNIPVYTKDKRQLVLSPELYYTYRWIDANNNEGYYPYPMDTIRKISVVASITEHVINVPLLVKYRFLDVMPGYIPSTYLEGGVQFGFPLKATVEDDNGYSKAYTNRNNFDFDILVGVGYGGPLGSGELFAGIRLGYSLLDFNKTYSSSLSIFSDIMIFWFF